MDKEIYVLTKRYFFIIFILLILVSQVGGQYIPSSHIRVQTDISHSESNSDHTTSSGSDSSTPTLTTNNNNNINEYIYPHELGDPILIKKSINPVSKEEYYNLGDLLKIYVEITNTKKNKASPVLNNISIREIVDNDFRVVSPIYSKKYEFSNICDCKLSLYEEWDIDERKENGRVEEPETFHDYIYYQKNSNIYSSPLNYSKIKDTYLFNLDNITKNNTEEQKNLLNILHERFDVNWAKANYTTINVIDSVKNGFKKNNSLIWINSTLNPEDSIRIDTIEDINNSKAMLIFPDDKYYGLKMKKTREGAREIFDWNVIQGINNIPLPAQSKLVYWYYVLPKREGNFFTESVIQILDDAYYSWPYIVYPMQIEITEPDLDFEVHPVVEKYNVYVDSGIWSLLGDSLSINYYITYRGKPLASYDNKRIIIELDESNSNYYYVDENGTLINTLQPKKYFSDFDNRKSQKFGINISYNETYTYPIPGMSVNGMHFSFNDQKITVDTPIERYNDIWSLILSIVAALGLSKILGKFIKKAWNWRWSKYIRRSTRRKIQSEFKKLLHKDSNN